MKNGKQKTPHLPIAAHVMSAQIVLNGRMEPIMCDAAMCGVGRIERAILDDACLVK